MEVEISYCNSIDSARISLSERKLNIRFAPNGTGKSTIARAMQFSLPGQEASLAELLPFKFREKNPDNIMPSVAGTGQLEQIMCFNEEYVSQFTFRQDELVANSFDILIKTDAYIRTEQEIESIISTIRQVFTVHSQLETLLTDLGSLSSAFKVTAASALSKVTKGMKALAGGNKLRHIPAGLEPYRNMITSDKSVQWIAWQTKGLAEFGELAGECCPYCSSESTEQQQRIRQVGQEYDQAVIKNLMELVNVIQRLGAYLTDTARERLEEITTLPNGLERQHETYLITLKSQTDDLIEKLTALKTLSGFSFTEGENVAARLSSHRLNLDFFTELQSEETMRIICALNASLTELISRAGPLQGKLNQQRDKVRQLVRKHQDDINGFLAYAGYRYRVRITDNAQPRLQLYHVDHADVVTGGSQHLSYGERNAFALVLFMYECLSRKPGLIILDDPISSFDKNKKFAILEMLFRRDPADCLKSKTVLMLTHDVEPIIDTIRSVRQQFNNQVSAAYLRYSRGAITEQSISNSDIKTFAQICSSALQAGCDDIIKLIYLRRQYEILDNRGNAYQVLSNLLHKRAVLEDMRLAAIDGGYPLMSEENVNAGCSEIIKHITGFDYAAQLAKITCGQYLTTLYYSCNSSYEKLQIFRLLDIDTGNSVIQKFINETYHIENEFICQLDPTRFDLIPEYVIAECDSLLSAPVAANDDVGRETA
ncbi:AAA family ATPase [Enterobacter hormaechei]|uniref:AAA family ATPase n=1 Tax=Enterobacter hormaechei TaxID=158836 RepID=UPI00163A709E|nr:AAA family ATPase [Enterobacter hormaechei]MBK1548172.1 AAA family ATPase [Enterobacter hormaechei]